MNILRGLITSALDWQLRMDAEKLEARDMTSRGGEWLTRSGWTAEALEKEGVCLADCAAAVETMVACLRDAWTIGLTRGFNGNMSLRLGSARDADLLLITGTGVAKGHIRPGDLALARLDGTHVLGAALSSETAMHVAIYAQRADARCVLHTHPLAMLALAMRPGMNKELFLRMPLVESSIWLPRLGWVPPLGAGSRELAEAVGSAFAVAQVCAVFMEGHGLCACGADAWEVLSICEQLEHMAATQLGALTQENAAPDRDT